MTVNSQIGTGANKAYVGGLLAAVSTQIGPVLFDGLEWMTGVDIPDDLETGLVTLIAGVLGWLAVWYTPNIP